MLANNNDLTNEDAANTGKPNAYRVDDDTNYDGKNPIQDMIGDDKPKPVREGQPMGGKNFGANNITPSGDDKNNPSQNAGYSNEYFRRTQPAEEHTESNNFKPLDQEGTADYEKAKNGKSDDDENETESTQTYEEGTADNDGQSNAEPNRPAPNDPPITQR
jgi:hypothetical protein